MQAAKKEAEVFRNIGIVVNTIRYISGQRYCCNIAFRGWQEHITKLHFFDGVKIDALFQTLAFIRPPKGYSIGSLVRCSCLCVLDPKLVRQLSRAKIFSAIPNFIHCSLNFSDNKLIKTIVCYQH
jgi:hypothetical protein